MDNAGDQDRKCGIRLEDERAGIVCVPRADTGKGYPGHPLEDDCEDTVPSQQGQPRPVCLVLVALSTSTDVTGKVRLVGG